MRRLSLAAVALLLSGCYHYVPAGSSTVARGTPVRMELRRPMSFEIPAMTLHNIGRITGEMIRDDDGAIVVSALWLDAVTGEGYPGQKWTVDVPEANVSSFRVRRVSAWRTAGILVAGALATYLGFEALGGGSDGGQSGNGGDVH
jgi:hypothetical protein